MCGRICCALCAPQYEAAASYYDKNDDEYKKPKFIESSSLKFNPSTNLSPTDVLPVLVWDSVNKCPVIKPMLWGLIPPWTTGNYKSGLYTTHNSRIEGVTDSRLYGPPLKAGKRCVVLCEGYYEWKTSVGKHKEPWFIYNVQPKGMKPEDESHWSSGEWSKKTGWTGPSLTCLAALYSAFDSKQDEGTVLNVTIMTMASSQSVSHIHHRMPAILSTWDQVKDWLNAEGVVMEEAISNLRPVESLSMHEVSSEVNSSRNKTPTCNKPLDTKKLGGKQTSLMSFFKKRPSDEASDQISSSKRPKNN